MSAAEFQAEHGAKSEHQLQASCVRWFKRKYPQFMIQSTPNAAKRSPKLAAMLKAEGMVTGWPDLQVAWAAGGYHGLFIEMKTAKGKPSDQQLIVHAYLVSAGYAVVMPRSEEEFQKAVTEYLKQ